MTREDIRVILNSEEEQDDKITLLLNRLNAEKSQIKANPEAQRKVEELEEKLNSTNDKMRSLRRELNEANKSLKTSEEEKEDNQNLLSQLQEKDSEIERLQKEIRDNKISTEINMVLTKSGVKNQKFADMITHSIDMSQIEIDKDGNVTGIEEQIEAIKEDEDTSMLFRTAPKNERQAYTPMRGEEKDISALEAMFREEREQKSQQAPADDPFMQALK